MTENINTIIYNPTNSKKENRILFEICQQYDLHSSGKDSDTSNTEQEEEKTKDQNIVEQLQSTTIDSENEDFI